MVKGISRQVILVKSPDPNLFDEAIFILKDSAVREGVTDEMLIKQAKQAMGREKHGGFWGLFLSMVLGGTIVAAIWAVTTLL